jgi:uncharacterized OsmC-like protein
VSRPKSILKYCATLSASEGFHVSGVIRKHIIDIDERPAMGGTDIGPNPVELLLASLGSCQIMLLKLHAEKLGVRIDSVEATAEGEIDVRGYTNQQDVRAGFQKIRVHTKLKAEGPSPKVQELLKIAEKCCPVYDTVAHGVPIESSAETL